MALILDMLIVISCIYFTTKSLFGKTLFNSIIYFMYFGVFVSFIWLRLNAPDVALAEITIGTTLTGALFFLATKNILQDELTTIKNQSIVPKTLPIIAALLIGLITLLQVKQTPETLPKLIQSTLQSTGVSNPVTAVLLNYRAYDTFIEILVLLAAAIGVMTFLNISTIKSIEFKTIPTYKMMPVVMLFKLILLPLIILFAGYSLWVGYKLPGGAFQSGAVLTGFIIILTWINPHLSESIISKIKTPLITGPFVFGFIGLILEISTKVFLTFPPKFAKFYILLIEVFSTLSIASALCLIYFGLMFKLETSND